MSARGARFLVVGASLDGHLSYGERAILFSDGTFADRKYWPGSFGPSPGSPAEGVYPGWVLYTMSPISGERAEYYPEKPPLALIPSDVAYWVLYEFGIDHLQAREGGGSARTTVGNVIDDIKHGAANLAHAVPNQGQIADFKNIPAEVKHAEEQLVEVKWIALGALTLGGVYVVAKLVGGR